MRHAAVLSQEELAERAGMTARALSDLECGRVVRPRPATVRRLADALSLRDDDRRAFERLGRSGDDRGAPPAQLPGTALFVGRATELAALDGLLVDGARTPDPTVCVVSGAPGVGKTALAVRWAHGVRRRFPQGQLFVDLRGYGPTAPMGPDEALRRLLRALGAPAPDPPRDVEELAGAFRSAVADRRMLMVLDNAASAEQVRPLLPGASGFPVVVTSRDCMAGLVAELGAPRLELGVLPEPDARLLLRSLLAGRPDADHRSTASLADRCGGLPLALRGLGELCGNRRDTPLADLVAEFASAGGGLDLQPAVRAAFSWSYARLTTEAALGFRLLGPHPGPVFDAHAAAALTGSGVTAARRILDELSRANLITRVGTVPGPQTYTIHPLLRDYARELGAGVRAVHSVARKDGQASRR